MPAVPTKKPRPETLRGCPSLCTSYGETTIRQSKPCACACSRRFADDPEKRCATTLLLSGPLSVSARPLRRSGRPATSRRATRSPMTGRSAATMESSIAVSSAALSTVTVLFSFTKTISPTYCMFACSFTNAATPHRAAFVKSAVIWLVCGAAQPASSAAVQRNDAASFITTVHPGVDSGGSSLATPRASLVYRLSQRWGYPAGLPAAVERVPWNLIRLTPAEGNAPAGPLSGRRSPQCCKESP